MTQPTRTPKVAMDLFIEQIKWAGWFFVFVFAVHAAVLLFVSDIDFSTVGFFQFAAQSASIFMLVLGIIAAYGFMEYYVQHGITRKEFFFGTATAAFGLAIVITLLPLLLDVLEYLLIRFASLPLEIEPLFSAGAEHGWVWLVFTQMLNVFTYYLIGWMIGTGYYRFGWLIGFGFVALALIAAVINGFFWGDRGLNTEFPWLADLSSVLTLPFAIAGSLVLIAALLAGIRFMTKRVPIRL